MSEMESKRENGTINNRIRFLAVVAAHRLWKSCVSCFIPYWRLLLLLLMPVGVRAAEVKCIGIETKVTCSGSGELLSRHVGQSGRISKYTYAKVESGITIIGARAFHGCRQLAQIDYPETVVEFKTSAFASCAFVTFHIRKEIVIAPGIAWNACKSLVSFTVESGSAGGFTVTSSGFLMKDGNLSCIGAGVGAGGTITLPSCNTILDGSVRWNDCVEIIIHDNTRIVEVNAFYACKYLVQITLGKNVVSFSTSALSGCDALTTIKTNGNTNFYYSNNQFGKKDKNGNPTTIVWITNSVKSITIPEKVTVIGATIFQSRSNLVEVTVASSNTQFTVYNKQLVLTKEGNSFCKAKCCVGGATSITVPDTVTSIGTLCFYRCRFLTSVKFHSGVNKFELGILRDCSNLTTIDFGGCIVSQIAQQQCDGCSKLTSIVNWPNNAFSIGYTSFLSCGLVDLSLPDTCREITDSGFRNCPNLETLTIPKTMNLIGPNSFYNCQNLKSVTFASGSVLKTIDSMAFGNCRNLRTVTLPDTLTLLEASAFSAASSLTSLITSSNSGTYVSDGTSIYKNSGNNVYYRLVICPAGATRISLNEETKVIGSHAFSGCNNLTDVNLNKVAEIETNAFYECLVLEMLRFPESVTSLQTNVFAFCDALNKVLYCGRSDIPYDGDPLPSRVTIYTIYNYTGTSFCGHKCERILDLECNLPTESFTMIDHILNWKKTAYDITFYYVAIYPVLYHQL